MTLVLNFEWLTYFLAIIFFAACIHDIRYDEYGTLSISAAAMGLFIIAVELLIKPAFEMSL